MVKKIIEETEKKHIIEIDERQRENESDKKEDDTKPE